jgi:hypothetical protein
MDEPTDPEVEEFLRQIGDVAEREGRIAHYLVLYFSLKEEHGLPRDEALTKTLEGIDDDLRPEVIEAINILEEQFPGGPSSERIEEMRRLVRDIGLDDPGPLQHPDEEGESG